MDNAQTGMQARVNVKCLWLAILPLMLGLFVGMFSETLLNMAGYRLYASNQDSPATFKFAH